MTDWWLQDSVVAPVGSAAAPNWWDADKVVNPAPAKPKDEDRSALKDVTYQIPQGIYQGAENLYNLPNNAFNWAAKKMGYEPPITPVHIAEDFNAAHGIGAPATTAGRYAEAVGEQLGGAAIPVAGTVARGAAAVPAIANAITSSVGGGVAGEAAKDVGFGPQGQFIASLAGGAFTPNAVNSAFSRGPVDPRLAAKTAAAEAAQEEGIAIPRAAVAGSMIKKTAGSVADMPIVGAPLKNAAREATDQIGNRTAEIANDYAQTGASANRSLSGNNVRDAIVDYIGDGSAQTMNRVYRPFDTLMQNSTTPYPLTETARRAQALLNGPNLSAAQRATNQGAINHIIDDLTNPNGLTVAQQRNLRTNVGTLLDDKLRPEAGTQEPALRALYGGLTQDVRNTTLREGGQPALNALDRADALNGIMVERRNALNKIVGKQGNNSGENVFENIVQMAKDSGKSANLDTLATARRAVGPEAWSDMSSAFIRRMGIDPKSGNYSADRALTAVGKLSPEGRTLLFNSTGRPDLARSLNNLSLVNQQFSELTKMGNPSGTGGITFLTSALGIGGVFAPVQAAQGIAGGAAMWGWSKYMASPANVDRMTRTLQARIAYTRNPNPTTEQRFSQAASALAASLKNQSPSQ